VRTGFAPLLENERLMVDLVGENEKSIENYAPLGRGCPGPDSLNTPVTAPHPILARQAPDSGNL
jgi:hypothetical protein